MEKHGEREKSREEAKNFEQAADHLVDTILNHTIIMQQVITNLIKSNTDAILGKKQGKEVVVIQESLELKESKPDQKEVTSGEKEEDRGKEKLDVNTVEGSAVNYSSPWLTSAS